MKRVIEDSRIRESCAGRESAAFSLLFPGKLRRRCKFRCLRRRPLKSQDFFRGNGLPLHEIVQRRGVHEIGDHVSGVEKDAAKPAGRLPDEPDDRLWEKHFKDWSDYVREFGTYSFPVDDEAHRDIAQWTRWQRLRRRRGKLSAERIRRLDEAGFPWNPKTELWESCFRQLGRFREIHGR